jgi:hypothetical protein
MPSAGKPAGRFGSFLAFIPLLRETSKRKVPEENVCFFSAFLHKNN